MMVEAPQVVIDWGAALGIIIIKPQKLEVLTNPNH
jgi:hypothetical protein